MTTHDHHPDAQRTQDVSPLTQAETTGSSTNPQQQSGWPAAPTDPQTAQYPSQDSTAFNGDGSTARRPAEAADARHAEVTDVGRTPPAETSPPMTPPGSAVAGTEPQAGTADVSQSQIQPSSEASLFADDDMAGLRARWNDVQAGFVDDPRDCVHKADELVSDVVKRLTAGFTVRVPGSKTSAGAAEKPPPRTFGSRSPGTATSLSDCSRSENGNRCDDRRGPWVAPQDDRCLAGQAARARRTLATHSLPRKVPS
jgi:hypothetical protein